MTRDSEALPPEGGTVEESAAGRDMRPARVLRFRQPAAPADDASLAAEAAGDDAPSGWRSRIRLGPISPPGQKGWSPPITGALAVIFGVAALFKAPIVLAPMAIALAFVAGFRGHHGWAVIGLGSALAGLLTSAWFWTLLGLAWLYQSWG